MWGFRSKSSPADVIEKIHEMFKAEGISCLKALRQTKHNDICSWAMLVPDRGKQDELKPQLNIIKYTCPPAGAKPHVAVRLELRGCLTGRRYYRDTPAATSRFLELDAARMNQCASEKGLVFRVWHPDRQLVETTDFETMRSCVSKHSPGYNAVDMAKKYPPESLERADFAAEAFDILHYIYVSFREDLFALDQCA